MTSSIFSSDTSKRPSVVRRPSDYLWEVEVDEEMPDVENHPPPAAFGTTDDEDESQRSTSYKFVGPQTRTLLLSVIPILFLIAGVVLLTTAFGQGHPGYKAMQNSSDHLSNNQESITSADPMNSQFDHNHTAEEGSQSVTGNMLPMYDGGTTNSGTIPAPAPTSSSAEKPARPPSAGGNIQMYDNEEWYVPPAYIGNKNTAGTVPASVSTPAKQDATQQEEDMEMYDNSIVYDNELWQEYNGNTETASTVPAIASTPAKEDTTNKGNVQMYDNPKWYVPPAYIGNTKTAGISTVSPAPTEEYNDSGDSRD